jgi:type II secretory ATPase GspE/PulE/Tfp pilus assembly ATPase PilB-like protein
MHGIGHPAGLFFRKLALMIGSGVPLVEALEAIAQGSGGSNSGPHAAVAGRMRQVAKAIADDVRRTGWLATALEAHPDIFPPDLIAIVRTGETDGTLDTALIKIGGAVEDGTLRVGRRRLSLPWFLRGRFGFEHHAHGSEGRPPAGPHGAPPRSGPQRPPPPGPHGAPPPHAPHARPHTAPHHHGPHSVPPHPGPHGAPPPPDAGPHASHHPGPHGAPPAPPPPPVSPPPPSASTPLLDSATALLRDGVRARATDVHVEPLAGGGRVRLRVDGRLREHVRLDTGSYARLIQDLKTFCYMDHAETRLPQEAHPSLEVDGKSIQLRVATSPYVYGEGFTARMLPTPDRVPQLSELGFSPAHMETLRTWLARSYGIICATGPTGCGKTTTMMALLASFDSSTSKVVSVEQPVEMLVEGVNQLSLKPELGLTWETAVRSQLKHDPDVVMVGEVPSPEVAQLILQTALTGHVVLTSFHADSPASLFERFVAIGLEPALVAQAVTGVIAQRLVRRLCEQCRERVDPPEVPAGAERALTDLPPGTYYRARGCPACMGSGYKGRIAVYELAAPPVAGQGLSQRPLIADALDKASQGMTTLDEVVRVCMF